MAFNRHLPPGGVINRSSSIARGLRFAIAPNVRPANAAKQVVDLVSGIESVNHNASNSSVISTTEVDGQTVQAYEGLGGGLDGLNLTLENGVRSGEGMTFSLWFRSDVTVSDHQFGCYPTAPSSGFVQIYLSAASVRGDSGRTTSARGATTTSTFVADELVHFTMTLAAYPALGNRVFHNGVYEAEHTSGWTFSDPITIINLGHRYGGFEADGHIISMQVWDRILTDGEITSLYHPSTRWAMFSPAQRFVPPAGGDVDVDVSATVGAIAITALSPTVSIDHDVAAALGALTITGHNPTVSIDHDISAAAGTIAITALSPTVSIDHDVAAALGAITLTAHDPSVDSTTNVALGGLTITGHKASVSIPSSDSDYYRPWTHARLSEQPDKNQFGDDPMNTNLSPPSVIDGRKMGTKATNLKRAVGGVEKSASKAGKGKQTKSTDRKR